MCIRNGFRLGAVVFCISDVLFGNMVVACALAARSRMYLENTYNHAKKNDTLSHSVIHYYYDRYSRLSGKLYPNQMQVHYTYNEYNGLANLAYEQLTKPMQTITQFSYTYNRDGNIRTRIRRNGQGQYAQEQYAYDANNNLWHYQCMGALCPQDQQHNWIRSQKYVFDSINNIKLVESEAVSPQGKTISNITTFYYSKSIPTQLLSYQNSDLAYGHSPTLVYDQDGNVIQDNQKQVLSYDAFDRIRSIKKMGGLVPFATYLYNGDNVQVGQKSANQHVLYWIYGQNQLVDSKQDNLLTQYIYGDMRLAKVVHGRMTYYRCPPWKAKGRGG